MKRIRKILFVHGTWGKVTTDEARETLDSIVGMFRRRAEKDESTDWKIDVVDETECVSRLGAGALGGYILVFNSKSQDVLAHRAARQRLGQPARVIVMTGDIPRDEVVFINKTDIDEVLQLAVHW